MLAWCLLRVLESRTLVGLSAQGARALAALNRESQVDLQLAGITYGP